MNNFGARLKQLRQERGFTQTTLALAAGLSGKGGQVAIARLESGHIAQPRWDMVCRLADALAVKTDAFR